MRIIALVKRICLQMLRDKRTLALMMVAPLVILTLIHFLFNSDTVNPRLGVVNGDAALIQLLKDNEITVKEYSKVKNPRQSIRADDLEGILLVEEERTKIIFENSDPSITKPLQVKIQQTLASKIAKEQAAKRFEKQQPLRTKETKDSFKVSEPVIETTYIYGDENTSFFDILNPFLVGFFVFFFVFLISGIALLRERTTGTLDRLMATPIRRSDIVYGYLLGYGLFAVIQTVIVVFFATNVLDIMLIGSIWHVILINLTLALVALSLGILLSAFANTEFQMMQFIPIVVIPQFFFAGIFPVEGMVGWLQAIAKIMPLYYAGNALQGVMYKGFGLTDISGDLVVLLGFAVLFLTLNVFALKKYRKI